MEKILKNTILEYLIVCHTPAFLRKKWSRRFEYYGINEDKMKDIFIIGALCGLITKMTTDYYHSIISDDILIEIDTLVIDFMTNKFS